MAISEIAALLQTTQAGLPALPREAAPEALAATWTNGAHKVETEKAVLRLKAIATCPAEGMAGTFCDRPASSSRKCRELRAIATIGE